MTTPRLILASNSPRRRELLGGLGLTFDVIPSKVDEDAIEAAHPSASPATLVEALAEAKATDIASQCKGEAIVIGADTVVVLDEHILGKPTSKGEAVNMLMRLSGRWHVVYTGVALVETKGGKITKLLVDHCTTRVEFAPFDEARASAYVASGEPMDKAGAYGIQTLGTLLIPRIDGDYFNVVGLPLYMLGKMFEQIGASLWP
jgi:septum formation protein